MTDSPIAGWYPDPQDAARWRWWSGADWTSEIATRPEAPAVEPERRRPADWGWSDSANTYTTAVEPEKQARGSRAAKPARQPKAPRAGTESAAAPTVGANTPWIWILAFSAYIWGIVAGALQAVGMLAIGGTADMLVYIGAAAAIIALAPLWVFADLDGRALRKRGFEAPSVLWMLLLPPIAYFLRRAALVKRNGGRSFGPGLALFIVTATLVATIVAGFSTLVAALQLLGWGSLG